MARKGTGNPAAEVTALSFHGSTAYIGTSLGLFKRVGSDYTLIDTSGGVLPNPFVQCIFPDVENSAWIGTWGGLVHINGEPHSTYTSENTPLCDNDITACAIAKNGDVWVGTKKGGLTVLKGIGPETAVGIPLQKNIDLKMVDISCRKVPNGTCNITIRSKRPATIGFYLVTMSGKLLRQFNTSPVQFRSACFIRDGS